MDTVSMLNTMSFYCQPVLPLVYDESMSYYETLCKVVGQLNTTGETVNKLNEGLTNEIADRQAADTALDERLKKIEEANKRTHFLVFDGANPNGGMPTRGELYQWVHKGDAIFTLFRTNEEGRGQIYAASCSYNAGNWGSESSNDFNIIVPIETSYDAMQDYAVKQKVAKLAIPLSPQTDLNVPWRLQIIEINTPSTSAEGVVNLVAVINDSNSVNCSITPSEFLGLYNMTRGGKNLCVAVNAKLSYDALARSSSVATVDTINRKVRIAFERGYGVYAENGVKQINKTFDYLIGNAETNVWTHESIDSRTFDFIRYEGFQFTREADNVITANDESTPNAVYAQYHSDTSGKIYQNLPVRLIDNVDNAEYWNGTFDIYDDKHMTFTFVASNYATASDKMLVRVIELSADANTTTWKYGVKEFTLPLSNGDAATYVDFWPTGGETYDADVKGYTVNFGCSSTYEAIFALINGGKKVVARLYQEAEKINLIGSSVHYAASGSESLGTINFQFIRAAANFLGFNSIADYILLIKTDASTQIYATVNSFVLPAPNPDGSDNGKIPTVKGPKWELSKADKRVVVSCNVAELVGYVDGYLAFSITCDHTAQEVVALLQDGVNVVATASLGNSNGIFIPSSWQAGDVPSVVFTGPPSALTENSVSPVTNIMLSSEKSYYRISAPLPPLQANVHEGRALVASDSASAKYSTVRLEDKAVRFDADNSAIEVTNGNFRFVAPDDAIATAENLRVDGTIVYDESQNLTEAQKQQARENIGVNASGSVSTKVTLNGDIEGNVKGYTSATYQQITNEIANNCNIWLTISRETVRLASYKQSGASAYTLVFFGAGDGALTVKYEVTASASSASLTVTGS